MRAKRSLPSRRRATASRARYRAMRKALDADRLLATTMITKAAQGPNRTGETSVNGRPGPATRVVAT